MTLSAACSRLASVDEFSASDCGCNCGLEASVIAQVLDDASDLVYYLTQGTWFGVCEGTVRPCRTCWCNDCRSCCDIESIQLRQDAIDITEITIDGDVLASNAYELRSGGRLVRLNPTDPDERPEHWPCCQKMYRPLTRDDTFGITYTFGQELIPTWVKNAVIELACDMATFFETGRSKLPGATTSVTMNNVTMSLQSRAEALRDETVLASFPAVNTLLGLHGPGRGGWAYSPQGGSAWTLEVV